MLRFALMHAFIFVCLFVCLFVYCHSGLFALQGEEEEENLHIDLEELEKVWGVTVWACHAVGWG